MSPDRAQPSCYLLEFSVSPGGARLGEVYADGTVDGLAELVAQREDPHGLDPYLVLQYGAVLQLWVVRNGEIVEGVDLRPYLYTGDPLADRTLARFLSLRYGERRDDHDEQLRSDALRLVRWYSFDSLDALPMLAQLFALHDRLAAADPAAPPDMAQLRDRIGVGEPPPPDTPGVDHLGLDWEAAAAVVPSLEGPLLGAGGVTVTWAPDAVPHPGSYLADPGFIPVTLYAGRNDLENGEDDFRYPEDEDLAG